MPRYQPFDWYEQPLYYDIIFDADTRREANFLEAVRARHGGTDGRRVIEPACGTGRLVAALAARGHEVTGFDASDAMLAFARRRLRRRRLTASLAPGRLERFRFPRRFDFAHCLVSTFKYLRDEASARSHLRCMAEALEPGGVYALGLHLSDYGQTARTRERWVARRGGIEVTCNIQGWPPDRRTRTERVRSRLVVRRGEKTDRYETHWTFRTYDLAQLRDLLRSVPRFEHVATYSFDCDIDSPIRLDGEHLDNLLVLRRG